MATKTLAENINQAKADLDAAKAAILERGIAVPAGTPTSSYGALIRKIEPSGGTFGEWQPDPLWWDHKAITEAELNSIPGYKPAAFILLQDNTLNTLLSNAGTGTNVIYKTSDGYQGASITHTWDRTKDKVSSSGYSTRYILVFTPDAAPNITISASINTINPLGIYCKYRYIASMSIGNSGSGDTGSNVEFIDIGVDSNPSLCSSTYWGSSLRRLKFLNLPKNLTVLGANWLDSPHSFNQTMIGQFPLVTTVGANFATGWVTYNQSIDNLFRSLTTLGSGFAYNWYSYNKVLVIPHTTSTLPLPTLTPSLRLRGIICTSPNWSASSWNISASTLWSRDTLVDFFVNLPNNTGGQTRTLVVGSANLAKVTAEDKLIATSKNYLLN